MTKSSHSLFKKGAIFWCIFLFAVWATDSWLWGSILGFLGSLWLIPDKDRHFKAFKKDLKDLWGSSRPND